jgi:flagellar protein FliS
MAVKGLRDYKEQAVSTMTQGEQLLMLYDELVKRLARAALALDQENYDLFEESVDRATAIIEYLDSVLDRQYPISQNLAQLYEYMSYELVRVKIGRNRTELDRVKGMADELRESFRQAEKHNDSGK